MRMSNCSMLLRRYIFMTPKSARDVYLPFLRRPNGMFSPYASSFPTLLVLLHLTWIFAKKPTG